MTINDLFDLIKDRKSKLPKKSYTTELFRSGLDRISQKVGEEAVEVVIASKNKKRSKQIEEISDLIYHLLVLMNKLGISIESIEKELSRRHNQ